MPKNYRPDAAARSSQSGPKTVPFAMFPHGMASDKRLSPVDRLVFCALLNWAHTSDFCTMADDSLAAYVGVSRNTIQRSLATLEALGYIRREVVPKTKVNQTGRIVHLLWVSEPNIIPAFNSPRPEERGAPTSLRLHPEPSAPSPNPAETAPPMGQPTGANAMGDYPTSGATTTPPMGQPTTPPVGYKEEVPDKKLEQCRQSSPPHPPGGEAACGGEGRQEAGGERIQRIAVDLEDRAKVWAKFDRCICGRTPRTQREVDELIDEVGAEVALEAVRITREKIDTQAGCKDPVRYLARTARNIVAEGGVNSRPQAGTFGVRKEMAIQKARKLRRDLGGPAVPAPRVRAISNEEFKENREELLAKYYDAQGPESTDEIFAEYDRGPFPEEMDWEPA